MSEENAADRKTEDPGENAGETGAPPPDEARDAAPATTPAPRRRPVLVPILLVGCLGGLAALGWQWWETRAVLARTQEELARRLAQGDELAREARAGARQAQDQLVSLQGKVGLLEAKVAESEGQAAALDALYQEFSRTRDERAMAEVEQAVTIAGQQLQLAGNVEAALIALQGAEARLAGLGEARLAPLRRSLQRDIERLKAAPRVDIPGIALKLEGLLDAADELPLAFTGEAQANAPHEKAPRGGLLADPLGYGRAVLADLWAELRALVRIERLDPAAEPVLLSPSQSTYLRENLKIRLLTARLALLARDGRSYEADLRQAAGWVERYFDLREARVRDALAALRALQAIQVAPPQPALTETLSVLKTLQSRSPAPAAPAAEAPPKDRPAAPAEVPAGEGAGAAGPATE